jgi:hypothetical protein
MVKMERDRRPAQRVIPITAKAQPAKPMALGLSPRKTADRAKDERGIRPAKTPPTEAGTLAMPLKKRM